ncbi:MAG TPA: 4-(cytidine 5'-diphospho)-2-C-methyl-D-erythritol kinase [Firmicutes bacterium]|jgi:4-diphosphocytidyl-2-C-methyl-D-erythritol kinase|nr:4-(cytidine 5'-diphospho)-2-C-methyl-D-erythritol kinase [Bacillota bacterium]
MTVIKALARAKINLSLDILGRRSDGYHELESVMQSVTLADELIFRPAAEVSLTASDPDLAVDESNTVLRAVRRLQEATGSARGVEIFLRKRIPPGAGLGGGSTDAAAVLVVLNRWWGLDLSLSALVEIAADVGSDVPFCLTGGTALVGGRGERVTRLPPLPAVRILLVKPPVSVATADVYRRFQAAAAGRRPETEKIIASVNNGRIHELTGVWGNLLEKVTFELVPGLAEAKKWLQNYGLPVLMTGSGPTLFALLPEGFRKGREIEAALREKGWWTYEGRLAGKGVEVRACRKGGEDRGEKTAGPD